MQDFVNDGAPLPPPGALRVFDVVWPTPELSLDATLLAERWAGYWVHWVPNEQGRGGRSRLCTEDIELCPWHDKNNPRWVAYIQAWNHRARKLAVVLLTVEAARQLQPFQVQYAGLRGKRFNFKRKGARSNAPVLVEQSQLAPLAPLPLNFEMGETLRVLLGTPYVPDRMVLSPDVPLEVKP